MEIINLRLVNSYSSLDEAFKNLNSNSSRIAVLKEFEKRLIIEKYIENYQISPESSNILIQDFCRRANINSEKEFEQFLFNAKQSKDSFIDRLAYQSQVEKLKDIIVSREEINDLFLKNKVRQDSVLFLLIRVKNEYLANELYYRIKDDMTDFGELAKQFSEGPEAVYGGMVGPAPINGLNPELRNILANLKEGEIAQPFQIDKEHFLITKLIKINKSNLNPQMEDSLKNEIFEIWLERQISLYQSSSKYGEEKA